MTKKSEEIEPDQPAPEPNMPERAGFLAQIEACRKDVAQWPEWMKATSTAPKWMQEWDD